MNAPAAISGTYADLKLVRGRKVAVICIEIPLEQAEQFVASFGMPDPAAEKWVALARLNGSSQEKWRPEIINPAKEAALICQKPAFWQFVREKQQTPCESEEEAATYVRGFCDVNSRADFATNAKALQRWQFLRSSYEDWMRVV